MTPQRRRNYGPVHVRPSSIYHTLRGGAYPVQPSERRPKAVRHGVTLVICKRG